MNYRIGLIACLTILMVVPGFGQSWTALKKKGDDEAKVGAYWEAAEYYYEAWKDKPNKLELAYKAGTYYSMVKDYARAAECLAVVSDWNDPDKLCGLHYARSLKQSSQHAEAISAFEQFKTAYQGDDRALLASVVDREIAGCREALYEGGATTSFRVLHAGTAINSKAPDFAPAPFGGDVVYFSSTRDGMAKLFRSLEIGGKWGKPDVPSSLPSSETQHIANGSFTPDGNRFYYTVCQQNTDENKLTTRCEIYVMAKKSAGWSKGSRLPDYINLQGVHQTHPTAVVLNGMEYLFFSSDRPGGEGGMDIWYSTRDAASSDMDYTLPESVGSTINTQGDEVTPFYDLTRNTLFFSSNGHVSLGGQDIYMISGTPDNWGTLGHPGTPVNSSADDLYFRLNAQGKAGFLSSNRLAPGLKVNTRDEDLFAVSSTAIDHVVLGQIYDKMSRMPLTDARVNIYHITNGEKVMFNSTHARNGQYEFIVPNELDAWVLAEKFEYEPSSYKINYQEAKGNTIIHDFYLTTETMPDEVPVSRADEISEVIRPEEAIDQAIAEQETPTDAPATASPTNNPQQAPAKQLGNDAEEVAALSTPEPTEITKSEPADLPQPMEEELNIAREDIPEVADAEPDAPVTLRDPDALDPVTPMPTDSEDLAMKASDPQTLIAEASSGLQDELNLSDPKHMVMDLKEGAPASNVQASAPPAFPMPGSSNGTRSASADLFTGTGIDMRYNGKRVDKRKYESETKPYSGIYYRIQLEATDDPDLSASRYAGMSELGKLETEQLSSIGLTRVLVGIMTQESEALAALRQARQAGFQEAYIVRYEDGVRLRRWK